MKCESCCLREDGKISQNQWLYKYRLYCTQNEKKMFFYQILRLYPNINFLFLNFTLLQ